MSFKDLTARAAAALKPKPSETAKTPANEKSTAEEHESKAAIEDWESKCNEP